MSPTETPFRQRTVYIRMPSIEKGKSGKRLDETGGIKMRARCRKVT